MEKDNKDENYGISWKGMRAESKNQFRIGRKSEEFGRNKKELRLQDNLILLKFCSGERCFMSIFSKVELSRIYLELNFRMRKDVLLSAKALLFLK